MKSIVLNRGNATLLEDLQEGISELPEFSQVSFDELGNSLITAYMAMRKALQVERVLQDEWLEFTSGDGKLYQEKELYDFLVINYRYKLRSYIRDKTLQT